MIEYHYTHSCHAVPFRYVILSLPHGIRAPLRPPARFLDQFFEILI